MLTDVDSYVYGRERLGSFWGYLAGWGFLAGKTASCAAMALTVVSYAAPGVGRYYAIANASAWTLSPGEGRPQRIVPIVDLGGCLVLAFSLPTVSALAGVVVLATGAALWTVRRATGRRPE